MDIVLIRLDCGFLFQGLKTVFGSEGGAANINAQKNLVVPSLRGLTGGDYGRLESVCLLLLWPPPVVAVRGVWSHGGRFSYSVR